MILQAKIGAELDGGVMQRLKSDNRREENRAGRAKSVKERELASAARSVNCPHALLKIEKNYPFGRPRVETSLVDIFESFTACLI